MLDSLLTSTHDPVGACARLAEITTSDLKQDRGELAYRTGART